MHIQKNTETKKVGIYTFHFAHNYGAMLQAFSLKRTIQKLGYDVSIIDYKPKKINAKYKITSCIRYNSISDFIKSLGGLLLTIKKRILRYNSFNYFYKYYLINDNQKYYKFDT